MLFLLILFVECIEQWTSKNLRFLLRTCVFGYYLVDKLNITQSFNWVSIVCCEIWRYKVVWKIGNYNRKVKFRVFCMKDKLWNNRKKCEYSLRRLLSRDCCRSRRANYCLCASFVSHSQIMGSFWLRSTIVPLFFIQQLNQVEVNRKRVRFSKANVNKL